MNQIQLDTVEFLKAWRGYTAGEIAGFKPYVAKQLVERGLARNYSEPKSKKRQKLDQDKNKTISDEAVNKA